MIRPETRLAQFLDGLLMDRFIQQLILTTLLPCDPFAQSEAYKGRTRGIIP